MEEESEHHQQERKGNYREPFPNAVVLCHVGRLELPQLGSQIVCRHFRNLWASPVAQWVKNLPAMLETQDVRVRSLGQEDPLQEAWQPTVVFLTGECHGQRSLAGHGP